MADTLRISLPIGFESPTDEDIAKAKRWTLLRNENAARLSSLIEDLLQDAAEEMIKIAYKYNCKPEDFQFSQDAKLREEIADIMNKLEEEIMALIEEYSLNAVEDEKKKSNFLPWLLLLHSKNTANLAGTLRKRLRQFLYDTEAQIAAMKMAGYKQTKAVSRVLSTMHAVYTSPEMQAAFKRKSSAMYIKSHGIHYGNVGLSNSGATNVENFGRLTAIQAWSHIQYVEAQEEGKAAFFVFRGSNYPCELCDSKCGFHFIDQEEFIPPFHGHCCCGIIYIDIQNQ